MRCRGGGGGGTGGEGGYSGGGSGCAGGSGFDCSGGGAGGGAALPACTLTEMRYIGGAGGGDSNAERDGLDWIHFAGAPTQVEMGVQASNWPCTIREDASVVTTVTGPDGGSVAHQNSGVNVGGVWKVATQISFTAPAPGTYTFEARYEPGLAVRRRVLPFGVDRTSAQPEFSLPDASVAGCDDFAMTDRDAVVCHAADGGRVFRAGTLEKSISAELLAVSGNSIWAYGAGQLARYVDDGTATFTSEQTTVPRNPLLLLPRPDEVVAV
ncbi:MAG: hypothetical protein IPJ65_05585 [Archangiaceae bacterium]|nr:hypothetical protein [Archangiaceae bacterium]